MSDPFSRRARTLSDPATGAFNILPDDATDLPAATTALNVATPGTIRVTLLDGSVSDLSVHPGLPFPVRATRVWSTGTTATGIRGLV